MGRLRRRRISLIVGLIIALVSLAGYQLIDNAPANTASTAAQTEELQSMYTTAREKLAELDVKGRAPKTGYERTQFGDGWERIGDCDVRNIILHRDMENVRVDESCRVLSGELSDPYTGEKIAFIRGPSSSSDVQIDHVVALSDAWQKGAQGLNYSRRVEFSNDPLNLLAVDGQANQSKSDSDAASWLPPNTAFRCQYVSRQVEVKAKYDLWVTLAEKQAMERVMGNCAG